MNSEEGVFCPYEQPMSRRRKAALYLTVGSAIVLCMFVFVMAWLALFG
ncbi:MAG: hypothetical protein ACM30H_02070 [Clostridia bacterium]